MKVWPSFDADHGLLGQINLAISSVVDATLVRPRSTTGIVEDGTSGLYYLENGFETNVPVSTVWDINGADAEGEVLIPEVTGGLQYAPTSAAYPYLSVDELKASIGMTGFTFADTDAEVAIQAAARGLEDAYDAYWTRSPDGEQRYYQAVGRMVMLGDVLSVTAVDVDYWGGQYGVSLTPDQYRLLPIQHGLTTKTPPGNGLPYRQLQLTRKTWPWPSIGLGMNGDLPRDPDGVRITGTFGYEFVPAGVKTAVTILATRMLRRIREAPFGIIAVGAEGAALRSTDIRRDPEIAFAMRGVSGARSLVR